MPPTPTDTLDVLIVDDEPETLDLLAEFCRSMGHSVATAQDGRAAITAIERAPAQFDLVLTDLHMPGADGFEVLRAARASNASSYVVMITGYATLDSALRAVREGAHDYLPKPFALGQLDIVLRRVRDRRALEAENRRLVRQASGRGGEGAGSTTSVGWRLDAIEERLANIEALLRRPVSR
ncbi:MAG: response regulator [Acidobacteria bacterium]|nr:response regulator [Acidobacteriota bacterium]